MKRETVKRVLALLICVWMTVSLLPAVAMAEEVTEDVIDDSTIEAYTSYENGEDAGVSGVSVTDEKPNTDIKVIPSDANALILMDTGAQSPKGVPGQVVKIVLPLRCAALKGYVLQLHGGGVVRVQGQRVCQ